MSQTTVETFRKLITLEDGARLLLRPLIADDERGLIALYSSAEPDDLRSLRDDVTNPEVIRGWIEDLDYRRVLPLVAVANERVVGNATPAHRLLPAHWRGAHLPGQGFPRAWAGHRDAQDADRSGPPRGAALAAG